MSIFFIKYVNMGIHEFMNVDSIGIFSGYDILSLKKDAQ